MKAKVNPDQGALIVPNPIERGEIPNPQVFEDAPITTPTILDYDPAKVDPNPGLRSDLSEGWGVLHKVIKEIARERSNQGFIKLPTDSHPVRNFAHNIDATPPEAHDAVKGATGKKYRHAQHRLNAYHDKQMRRSRAYNAVHRIVPDKVLADALPLDAASVEYRYFYANTPAEKRALSRKRQAIARVVLKHTR